jgi:hypothetical protein
VIWLRHGFYAPRKQAKALERRWPLRHKNWRATSVPL